ncbi:MAG: hypothetical protein AB8B69_24580 [Chitinophagales bacterium]
MNTQTKVSIKNFEKLAINQTQTDQVKGGNYSGNAAWIIDW